MAKEAAAYVDTVLALMAEHMYASPVQDWAAVRRQVLRVAGGARSPVDTYGALQHALQRVDAHSFLLARDEFERTARIATNPERQPRGELIAGRFGYLVVPGITSTDNSIERAYARKGQELIRSLDPQACGWIVDLRSNTGGSLFPMLLAIGPLIGDGIAALFVDNRGRRTPWGYSAGGAWAGDSILIQLPEGGFSPRITQRPVAVLIGPGTVSAGEQIAIALWGHGNKTFGSVTAGRSSGNRVYQLPDSALLVLTEVVLANRYGQVMQQIQPDSTVGRSQDNRRVSATDRTAQAALRWLSFHATCR